MYVKFEFIQIKPFLNIFFFPLVFTRFPLITLGVCTAIILGLSVGIFFIEITTDPVDLWAAPHRLNLHTLIFFVCFHCNIL